MKKKNLLLTLLFALLTIAGFSQTEKSWILRSGKSIDVPVDKAVTRQSFPKEFKLMDFKMMPLKQELLSITGKTATKHSTIISLPNADGQLEQFEVFEASNFDEALRAQFPEITAFTGKGITDKSSTLKMSISPQGIQTMVFRTEKENEFMEPYSHDRTIYAVYKSQRTNGRLGWICGTQDQILINDINTQLGNANIFSRSGSDWPISAGRIL